MRFRFPVLRVVVLMIGCFSAPAMHGGCSTAQEEQANQQEQSDSSNGAAQKSDEESKPHAHQEYPANHLVDETSPYLLMHAHNPVDWYPWGEEALAKAKRENKPIFLSIGYAACHWCHVMERESFMDEEIAKILNEHFVCIKVDREERPDIDTIYMRSLTVYNQLSRNGRGGGWPLSMFLTPEAKPFYGGTYFPPNDKERGFSFGFRTLISSIQKTWETGPENIQKDADTITRVTQRELAGVGPSLDFEVSNELLVEAQSQLEGQFDEAHGGFGFEPSNDQRPKFPEPSNLLFLLNQAESDQPKLAEQAARMLTATLDQMAAGGIQDHLGGGFHRYSVDRFWHIPHFEKMLYDNGQLLTVYSRAYALTGNEEYRIVAEGIADFVLRELRAEQGGFFSSLDADSEGEEGKFYRWTAEEVESILEQDDASSLTKERFRSTFQMDAEPNFEGEFYALQRAETWQELAEKYETTIVELRADFQPIIKRLWEAREQRIRPPTDDKILAAWNGLMIAGLADAGRILERADYTEAAAVAGEFAWTQMRQEDGRLFRTFGEGQAKLNAYVVDYAMLIDGYLRLHEATGDPQWLNRADQLMMVQIENFWDPAQGGFFFTSSNHESLLARAKNPTDGAVPSGNSVSAQNLLELANQVDSLPEADRPDYQKYARETIRSISALLDRAPAAAPRILLAIDQLLQLEKSQANK